MTASAQPSPRCSTLSNERQVNGYRKNTLNSYSKTTRCVYVVTLNTKHGVLVERIGTESPVYPLYCGLSHRSRDDQGMSRPRVPTLILVPQQSTELKAHLPCVPHDDFYLGQMVKQLQEKEEKRRGNGSQN